MAKCAATRRTDLPGLVRRVRHNPIHPQNREKDFIMTIDGMSYDDWYTWASQAQSEDSDDE